MKSHSVADMAPVAVEEQFGDSKARPDQSSGAIVAVPVRNEAGDIEACLQALAAQQGARLDAIVLCLNNCTDGTAQIVRRIGRRLPVAVTMLQVVFPSHRAGAGVARRIAMDRAAELAGSRGVVLTTDADGQVESDWLAGNLAALADGVDAVAGRAVIEPEGAKLIPEHLHVIDARECAYAALLDELRSLLDPDPFDPWPRHDEHSGASIAVTAEAYRSVSGLPPLALGEDRAFFEALRRIDARIRHAPEVRVIVSARIHGRAHGGMADTIRRRMQQVDALLDDRVEPTRDALRRIRLQAHLRCIWQAENMDEALARRLGTRLGLPADALAAALSVRHFGTAWATLEARSPVLRHRRRVALADLSRESATARRLVEKLRTAGAVMLAADPADTALHVAAE